jgi:hypothetical protein
MAADVTVRTTLNDAMRYLFWRATQHSNLKSDRQFDNVLFASLSWAEQSSAPSAILAANTMQVACRVSAHWSWEGASGSQFWQQWNNKQETGYQKKQAACKHQPVTHAYARGDKNKSAHNKQNPAPELKFQFVFFISHFPPPSCNDIKLYYFYIQLVISFFRSVKL